MDAFLGVYLGKMGRPPNIVFPKRTWVWFLLWRNRPRAVVSIMVFKLPRTFVFKGELQGHTNHFSNFFLAGIGLKSPSPLFHHFPSLPNRGNDCTNAFRRGVPEVAVQLTLLSLSRGEPLLQRKGDHSHFNSAPHINPKGLFWTN